MASWEGKLGQAIALAAEVHQFQMDKADEAYILHPLEVMKRAKDYYLSVSDGWHLEAVMIVAVLHDVFEDLDEDNKWSIGRLRDYVYQTFGSEVYAAVDALTKVPGESYQESYIPRVKKNWMARIGKIADVSHNLDAFRLPSGEIGERDFKRWDKYHRTLVSLLKTESEVR